MQCHTPGTEQPRPNSGTWQFSLEQLAFQASTVSWGRAILFLFLSLFIIRGRMNKYY